MPNYLFDVKIFAAVRLSAPTDKEARAKLATLFDCAAVNAGELDGEPVTFEASLDDNEEENAELVEIDGEPV